MSFIIECFNQELRRVESYFSPSKLLAIQMGPAGTHHLPTDGILEIWQKLVKVKISYQSQLSQISACSAQSRKEDKIPL